MKSLTFKKKFFLVIVLFIILLIGAYNKSFKSVLNAKSEVQELEEKINKYQGSNNLLNQLQIEINAIEQIIGGSGTPVELVQSMILDFISNSDYNINVVTIDDVHKSSDENFTKFTNKITVSGRYPDLLRMLYDIEKDFKHSRIVSTSLYTKKVNNSSKVLIMDIILQNYEKVN